jgi:prepilin-type N-terminal cleavage/methylation domain-containing protein
MKIRENKGVTLIELMIAISLLTLIMAMGSGIFLSANNMAEAMINAPQAQCNAQDAIMHIEKNVCKAASNFDIVNRNGNKILTYMTYRNTIDIYSTPTVKSQYVFDSVARQLKYYYDINLNPNAFAVVANHISDCTFTTDANVGVVLQVSVRAFDNANNTDSAYTVNTQVEAVNAASPAVFTVSTLS